MVVFTKLTKPQRIGESVLENSISANFVVVPVTQKSAELTEAAIVSTADCLAFGQQEQFD